MPDLPDDLAALLRDRAEHAPVPRAADDAIVHAVRRRQYARAGTFVSGTALAVAAVVGVAAAVTPTRTGTVAPTTGGPTTGGGGGTPEPDGKGTGCAFLRQEVTADTELYLGDVGTLGPAERATSSAEPAKPIETHEERTTEPTPEPTLADAPVHLAQAPEYGFTADVDAERHEFRRTSYETLAGTTCMVATNDGAGKHNLQLRRVSTGEVVWEDLRMAPRMAYVHDAQRPLAAGRYTLVCTIHPSMRADVIAR